MDSNAGDPFLLWDLILAEHYDICRHYDLSVK